MQKKYFFGFLVLMVLALPAFVLVGREESKEKRSLVYSPLLPRKKALELGAEWKETQRRAADCFSKLEQELLHTRTLAVLAGLYIQEGRATGNFDYYNKAALKCIDALLEKDNNSFEGLTLKGTVLLSQHRFAEALVIAGQARDLYPLNAYVYGLLVDANVELGNYHEALVAADKMVSIRPDNRSYSRIAYLREIFGDPPGAIEAMQMAVDAGAIADENTEWCRVQLGRLYEKTGNLPSAKMQYSIALGNRPNFPYALAGLARITTRENKWQEALQLYMKADSLIDDHLFKEGIIEVYNLVGKHKLAAEMLQKILNGLLATGDQEVHELAHACMGVGDYKKALEYALQEYKKRPGNIEVNETLAKVYYASGEFLKAKTFIDTALKTNCKNPELLCQAGLIYYQLGLKKEAKAFLKGGLERKPYLPYDLEKAAAEVYLKLIKKPGI